jgi:hypothetical protein
MSPPKCPFQLSLPHSVSFWVSALPLALWLCVFTVLSPAASVSSHLPAVHCVTLSLHPRGSQNASASFPHLLPPPTSPHCPLTGSPHPVFHPYPDLLFLWSRVGPFSRLAYQGPSIPHPHPLVPTPPSGDFLPLTFPAPPPCLSMQIPGRGDICLAPTPHFLSWWGSGGECGRAGLTPGHPADGRAAVVTAATASPISPQPL